MIEQLFRAGRRCVPHQHEPRRPGIEGRGDRRRSARWRRSSAGRSTILADLQGPEAARRQVRGRQGRCWRPARSFTLDRDPDARRRDARRAAASRDLRGARAGRAAAARRRQAGAARRSSTAPTAIVHAVEVGGVLSNSKGLNVPDVVRADGGADREGPQRPGLRGRAGRRLDRAQLRPAARGSGRGARLIGGKAALLAKIEKPAAIDRLEEIVELCDGVMVARGDLGVELPPEDGAAAAEAHRRDARGGWASR